MVPEPNQLGAHAPVVEAEEVHSLATRGQVHDPRLGRFRFETEIGQHRRQHLQGSWAHNITLIMRGAARPDASPKCRTRTL